MRTKIILLSILAIVLVIIAFGSYSYLQQTSFQEISAPYIPLKKVATPATTTVEQVDVSSWIRLESKELGIIFSFPSLPGDIKYEFHEWPEGGEPMGSLYGWEVKRTDIRQTSTFAGGASSDLVIGRSRSLTDNYRWFRDKDKYFIEQTGHYFYEVKPFKVVIRPDGLIGLIFDPNENFFKRILPPEIGAINPTKTDRAAILNFPENYHQKLKSITFYFYDETSVEDIEKVMRSVTFSK